MDKNKILYNMQDIPEGCAVIHCCNPEFLLNIELSEDECEDFLIKNSNNEWDFTSTDYDELINDLVNNGISEYAFKKVCEPLGELNPGKVESDYFNAMYEVVEKEIRGNIYLLKSNCAPEPVSIKFITDQITRIYEDSSSSTQYSGGLIISNVTKFLQQGKWHLDYRDNGLPYLWFGLDNTEPLKIWSLPFDSERPYTSWKTMWFFDFWALDWNAILGGYDDFYTVWMFEEFGMSEPEEERDAAREKCPILLTEDDTSETIQEKINVLAAFSK